MKKQPLLLFRLEPKRRYELIGYWFCCALVAGISVLSPTAIFPILSTILFSLFFLWCLLKAIRRVLHYHRAVQGTPHNTPKDYFADPTFNRQHFGYRLFAIAAWVIFLLLCLLGKVLFAPPPTVFLAICLFLCSLDIVFYSKYCLFTILYTKFTGSKINCCHLCPIRGWDFLMYTSALLFTLDSESVLHNIGVIITLLLMTTCLILWEVVKFRLLPIDQRRRDCVRCNHTCGKEYGAVVRCFRTPMITPAKSKEKEPEKEPVLMGSDR